MEAKGDISEAILYERLERAIQNIKKLCSEYGLKPSDECILEEAGTNARTLFIDKQRAFQIKSRM